MKSDIVDWFALVERLRHSRVIWLKDELPVEIIQTHISVILLGKHRVLKLKKPVDFGFLDYTTLEKRRRACEREVELNSRLCPEIYLGTQPIVEDKQGFRFSDNGNIVDYGVLMKRLPEERMLDLLVVDNTISEAMIAQIAEKLASFHKTARRGEGVDVFGNAKTIRFNWKENFEQTKPFIGRTISSSNFEMIREWTGKWLDENSKLLNERVKHGYVCDGHGDLRCESICITNGICIFDCIEFNDRFRCSDVANEVAFLAMDLAAFGRPDLGYFFFERYSEITGDDQLFKLFSFYRCYRAFVRGKVLSFQLDEPEVSKENRVLARQRAENYFQIAMRSAKQLLKPTVIMIGGLSGTGKTAVARAIAGELGLRVVSSDAVRKSVFGDEDHSADYGEGIYNEESRRLIYQKMLEKGLRLLQTDGSVILDATFQNRKDREVIMQKAEFVGAEFRMIECRLSAEIVRQRLDRRTQNEEGFSDATWQTYEQQTNHFALIEINREEHFILNTENNLAESCRDAADWLRSKDFSRKIQSCFNKFSSS